VNISGADGVHRTGCGQQARTCRLVLLSNETQMLLYQQLRCWCCPAAENAGLDDDGRIVS